MLIFELVSPYLSGSTVSAQLSPYPMVVEKRQIMLPGRVCQYLVFCVWGLLVLPRFAHLGPILPAQVPIITVLKKADTSAATPVYTRHRGFQVTKCPTVTPRLPSTACIHCLWAYRTHEALHIFSPRFFCTVLFSYVPITPIFCLSRIF